MKPRLGGGSNRERLDSWIVSLECPRWWGDLIEVYTITSGLNRVANQNLISQNGKQSNIRGQSFKVRG